MSAAPGETIRIESENRRDALDLADRLDGLHTYLVQLGDRRWLVCVKPGAEGRDLVPELLRTAAGWAADRRVDSVLRVGDRAYDVRG